MVKNAANISHEQMYKRRNTRKATDCLTDRVTGNLKSTCPVTAFTRT